LTIFAIAGVQMRVDLRLHAADLLTEQPLANGKPMLDQSPQSVKKIRRSRSLAKERAEMRLKAKPKHCFFGRIVEVSCSSIT
jgi:hypothetical protein